MGVNPSDSERDPSTLDLLRCDPNVGPHASDALESRHSPRHLVGVSHPRAPALCQDFRQAGQFVLLAIGLRTALQEGMLDLAQADLCASIGHPLHRELGASVKMDVGLGAGAAVLHGNAACWNPHHLAGLQQDGG
jgi:hypothetical protein